MGKAVKEKDVPKGLPGIVWHKNKWRLFYEWKKIEKGAYKNMIEIQMIGEKLKVKSMHIKRFPGDAIEEKKKDIDKPWIIKVIETQKPKVRKAKRKTIKAKA